MDLEQIKELISNSGKKITDQRIALSEIFLRHPHQYLSAKKIRKMLEEEYNFVMSFDTIYNNLYMFRDLRIIEEQVFHTEAQYCLNHSLHPHHHIICTKCGKKEDIEDLCPHEELEARYPNYLIINHIFEVYGICDECQQKAE
ncbi:Fur family transcriptional regulator [Culicoidibacter larvae]|nr:Fur family transcriptional regulator [Culicoidibacter larvae]